MEIDKKKVIDSFKRFITQTAREHNCKDNDIYFVLYEYLHEDE